MTLLNAFPGRKAHPLLGRRSRLQRLVASLHAFNELKSCSAERGLQAGKRRSESTQADGCRKPTVYSPRRPLSPSTFGPAVEVAMNVFQLHIHSFSFKEEARVVMFASLPLMGMRLRRVQEIFEVGDD